MAKFLLQTKSRKCYLSYVYARGLRRVKNKVTTGKFLVMCKIQKMKSFLQSEGADWPLFESDERVKVLPYSHPQKCPFSFFKVWSWTLSMSISDSIRTSERKYTYSCKNLPSPILVDFYRAIKLSQLFFQQLQIWIHETQLQSHGFSHFLVGSSSVTKEKWITLVKS